MYKKNYFKSLFLLAMLLLGAGNISAADKWVKTSPASLQTGDIVVIVDQTSEKAMSNDGGTSSAPTAVTVDFNSDKSELVETYKAIAATIQWTVNVSDEGLAFYADDDNFLYCTNTNNGVRVGDINDNHFFEIKVHSNDVGFLFNKGTSRYLGVYNNQDWRCYSSVNTNINTCVTAFYKKETTSGATDPLVTISGQTVNVGKTLTINYPENLPISFISDDTSIATVDNDGVVTGVEEGETTITASWEAVANTYNAGSKEFTVNVTPAISSTEYEKVTSTNQLVAGNKYILVAENSNVAMGAVNASNAKIRDGVEVTIANEKIEITDEAVAVLTLGGSAGAWTFLASDNDKYLALTGNSNEVHASDDATLATSKWIITDDFQLETTAQNATRYLRYNSGSPRFACYKSGQVTAILYMKAGGDVSDKADADLSFGETTAFEVNLGEEFAAPTLSNPNQLEVVYTSSNTDVATVDETTGAVTIVAAGQTTITASFAGNDEYNEGSASYTLTVVDPNAPGTENNPYTVAQAIEYINTLGSSTSPNEVYVSGIISQVDSYNPNYKSITYWISDDGTTSNQMEVYGGKGLNDADFASVDDLQVGDIVIVKGYVKTYNGTPEFDKNNQLVAFERPATTDPTINAENVTIAYDAASGEIPYTIDNPVEGYEVTVSCDADWLSNFMAQSDKISFSAVTNEGNAERSAEVTINYGGSTVVATKTVTVTQGVNPDYTMTIAEVRAQTTGNVMTKGVVTSCVGKTAYIQDATAAICVYGTANLNYTIGDEIKVSGTLSTYKGLLEITNPDSEVLSSDNTVTPEVKTIAEINADYADDNALQGWLVKIENAKVSAIDGQNTTIAQDDNTIVVRGITGVELAVDDMINLVGNIGCFDAAQIANPTDVEVLVEPEVEYYLAGSFAEDGWDEGMLKMTNKNGIYSVTKEIEAETEFKIVKKDVDGTTTWYGGEGENVYQIHRDWCTDIVLVDGENFIINEAGEYTFSVNTTGTALTLSVDGFPAQQFFMAGSFNDWSTTATQFEVGETEGVYTLTQELEAGAEFKVVSEGKWYGTTEAISAENCTALPLSDDSQIANMTVPAAGEYTFTLEKTPNGLFLSIAGFPEPVVTYYLAGSWNEWSEMVELAEQEDGSFVATQEFPANTEFKIVKDVDGEQTWYGGDTQGEGEVYGIHSEWCTDIALTAGDAGKNFIIEAEGNYTFTMNITDNGMFLSVAGWPVPVVEYALVSDASKLEAGKKILFVGEKDGVYYAMGAQNNNNRAAAEVDVVDGKIIPGENVAASTLVANEDGTWSFLTAVGYLYAASNSSNHLKSEAEIDDYAKATISIGEDNLATILFGGDRDRNDLRFNSTNNPPIFSCYAESNENMKHVYIYMETSEEVIPETVTAEVSAAGLATFCSEWALDFTGIEEVYAYKVSVNEKQISYTRVYQVPAETGVVLRSLSGDAVSVEVPVIESADEIADNALVGVLEAIESLPTNYDTNGYTNYILNNGSKGVGFYKANNQPVGAGKAYLQVEGTLSKDFIGFADGVATGIETIDNGWTVDNEIYDLQGRKVMNPTKGIFIQNGRKVVIK